MTPERWQQIRDLLEQALELAPEQRAALLDRSCVSDPSLRQEVEVLLAASDGVRSSFLQSSITQGITLTPITSCPSSLNTRLTHGECIPVSNAIRHCGVPSNASRIAFGVVLTFSSTSTAPDSSSRQYQLDRSPRSNPIVSFASEKFLICFVTPLLTFFIAGFLYLLRFKARR